MAGKSRSTYENQYIRENYHRISLNVRKEKYEDIKKAASDRNETVNGFIKQAIDDRLDKEKKTTE